MCSHDPFFGIKKYRILKNGSCEQELAISLTYFITCVMGLKLVGGEVL